MKNYEKRIRVSGGRYYPEIKKSFLIFSWWGRVDKYDSMASGRINFDTEQAARNYLALMYPESGDKFIYVNCLDPKYESRGSYVPSPLQVSPPKPPK